MKNLSENERPIASAFKSVEIVLILIFFAFETDFNKLGCN